jgi:hypothetical protein
MDDSLNRLTYANFKDIPDITKKLSIFFNETQINAGSQGFRLIPRPIAGYACLDNGRIVAISYYIIPKKRTMNYLQKFLLQPVKVETGTVIMQEYRNRGIYRELISKVQELMHSKAYTKK